MKSTPYIAQLPPETFSIQTQIRLISDYLRDEEDYMKEIVMASKNFEEFKNLMLEYNSIKFSIKEELNPTKTSEEYEPIQRKQSEFYEKLYSINYEDKETGGSGKHKKTRKNRKSKK